MDEGVINLHTLKENKGMIEFVAESRVTGPEFILQGMSQQDCDVIKRNLR